MFGLGGEGVDTELPCFEYQSRMHESKGSRDRLTIFLADFLDPQMPNSMSLFKSS